MTAGPHDRVYRIHPDDRRDLAGKIVHVCRALHSRFGGQWMHREHIDPCAANRCRFCGETL